MSSVELLKRAKDGDAEACGKAVEENSGLIWSIARRFFGQGAEPEDLYQLGCLGFLKSVRGFDFDYGTQFSTYAVPKITGEIRRFLRDDGLVKVSRASKEAAGRVRRARETLSKELGREPRLSELSAATGLSIEDIAAAELAAAPAESLDRPRGDDGKSLEETLPESIDFEERLAENIALKQAVDELPPRERTVVTLRFFRGLTQARAAAIIGVSQVQVSRLEKSALIRLRRKLS